MMKLIFFIFLNVTNFSCIENCADGKEYDFVTETCVDCKIGYIRTRGTHDTCILCPNGLLTAQNGSFQESQCNIGESFV